MIITIDGPAGTGKTTVARNVAEKLKFSYFDTGAMYRAVTWLVLKEGVTLEDEENLKKLLSNFEFRIKEQDGEKRYFVGETDITKEIRTEKVTSFVSQVAALGPIRQSLSQIQRAFGKGGSAVFEGRDMGTTVFPNADAKFFLTARPEVRAGRRLKELIEKHPEEVRGRDKAKMLEEIEKRDEIDSSRAISPLKCADDAHVIDTSDLSIDEVVEQIVKKCRK